MQQTHPSMRTQRQRRRKSEHPTNESADMISKINLESQSLTQITTLQVVLSAIAQL